MQMLVKKPGTDRSRILERFMPRKEAGERTVKFQWHPTRVFPWCAQELFHNETRFFGLGDAKGEISRMIWRAGVLVLSARPNARTVSSRIAADFDDRPWKKPDRAANNCKPRSSQHLRPLGTKHWPSLTRLRAIVRSIRVKCLPTNFGQHTCPQSQSNAKGKPMNTKHFLIPLAAVLMGLMASGVRAQETTKVDIKRAAPTEAFLAVYAKHNPERDYERQYYAEAWKTIQDEQICQRIVDLVTSRVPQEKLNEAKATLEQLQTAAKPINVQALINADEFVMAEVFEGPFNQVIFAARMNAADAADCERGLTQFAELITRWSDGKVAIETSHHKEATLTVIKLPKESPFQPAFGRVNDIVVVATSESVLRKSLEQMQDASAKSKFDDPRLQDALTHLPKPEDAIVFFDGQKLFQNLRGLTDFIRGQAKNDAHALQVVKLIDRIIDAVSIVDYEATVAYTEPGQNRQATLGKLSFDYKDKLLGRVLSQSKPLENWQNWIPRDATAFSLSAGINLHELYDGVLKIVQEEIPDSRQALEKFAAIQEQIGFNLDRDILQSFSGESVEVKLPLKAADGSIRSESVNAMKCSNPEKIRELLGRAVNALNKIPAVQAQQLKLEDVADLKGFQQLRAAFLPLFSAQPVIGFRDDWMIFASSPEAAKKVLAVRAGEAESVAAANLEKLGFDFKNAVYRVSYEDIGARVRHIADIIDKAGAMAPMFVGMAAANAKPEDLKSVQDAVGLLPSIAKVVRKFDFYGHSISDTRVGPVPGTYLRDSVTEVRSPEAAH